MLHACPPSPQTRCHFQALSHPCPRVLRIARRFAATTALLQSAPHHVRNRDTRVCMCVYVHVCVCAAHHMLSGCAVAFAIAPTGPTSSQGRRRRRSSGARDTQRHRDTETQTQTQTHTDTHRHIHTHTEVERSRKSGRERHVCEQQHLQPPSLPCLNFVCAV